MHRIRYAGGAYITGDAIADIVMEYAAQLAKRHLVDAVDIRVRQVDGTTGSARLLVGDAIAIGCETLVDDGISPEIVDPAGVEDLEQRCNGLVRPRGPESRGPSEFRFFDDTLDL